MFSWRGTSLKKLFNLLSETVIESIPDNLVPQHKFYVKANDDECRNIFGFFRRRSWVGFCKTFLQ